MIFIIYTYICHPNIVRMSMYEISALKLQEGDSKELKKFYEKNYALFVAFAKNIIPIEDECKDIVHDVFMKFWNTRETFDNLNTIKAFFYKSIRNQCLNSIRHGKVHDRFTAYNLGRLESHEFLYETIIKEETIKIIYEEISRLSGMEQKVLMMAMEGKTNEEIAEILHIAVSTVKTHKVRSYVLLRKKLNILKLLILTI